MQIFTYVAALFLGLVIGSAQSEEAAQASLPLPHLLAIMAGLVVFCALAAVGGVWFQLRREPPGAKFRRPSLFLTPTDRPAGSAVFGTMLLFVAGVSHAAISLYKGRPGTEVALIPLAAAAGGVLGLYIAYRRHRERFEAGA